MANTVWPGVWPGAASVTMPGATSAPGSKRVTLLRDIGKYAPLIAEREFQIRGGGVHIGVVHPEIPLGLRHHDLGVGKHQIVVLVFDAVDVVGMEMRNDDEVDGFRIDARRRRDCRAARRPTARSDRRCRCRSAQPCLPVLTISVVNGVASLSAGMNASASALSTSANGALRMNLSVIGRYQMPS